MKFEFPKKKLKTVVKKYLKTPNITKRNKDKNLQQTSHLRLYKPKDKEMTFLKY